jgi:hypothetical protein
MRRESLGENEPFIVRLFKDNRSVTAITVVVLLVGLSGMMLDYYRLGQPKHASSGQRGLGLLEERVKILEAELGRQQQVIADADITCKHHPTDKEWDALVRAILDLRRNSAVPVSSPQPTTSTARCVSHPTEGEWDYLIRAIESLHKNVAVGR